MFPGPSPKQLFERGIPEKLFTNCSPERRAAAVPCLDGSYANYACALGLKAIVLRINLVVVHFGAHAQDLAEEQLSSVFWRRGYGRR